MAITFRCKRCGKLLCAEGAAGQFVACPACKARLLIPEMLASLPRPKIMDERGCFVEFEGPHEEQREQLPAAPAPAAALQTALPWAISAVFHLAVFLVMVFFVVWTYSIPDLTRVIIPSASLSDQPGGMMNPVMDRPEIGDRALLRPALQAKSKEMQQVSLAALAGTQELAVIGVPTGGRGALEGLEAAEGEPQSGFVGSPGGNARKIVYVIDRSGSMSDPELFDVMKAELVRSIGGLDARQQSFHVMFFSSGEPLENPPRRMVPATSEHKQKTYDFLAGVLPEGATDPSPALRRAFSVPGGPPDLIYLLTDGVFDERILSDIRKWNARSHTRINTIAFAYPTGEKLLEKMATENGGKYRFVSLDEIAQRKF